MSRPIEITDALASRMDLLKCLGADGFEADELLKYNENVFNIDIACRHGFPLPDEPFVPTWAAYAERGASLIEAMCEDYPQLAFPVASGINKSSEYMAATRKGQKTANRIGLPLSAPERCRVVLHPTLAGSIPLLVTPVRMDFELLVQALSKQNEPVPIPQSMGACMIAGSNNWGRVRQYRARWEERRESSASEADWQDEFRRLIPRRELYQDRFIILSDGPYSGVLASAVGLGEDEWRAASFVIRREHESTHYFTRRVFGSMRNNALDELIADYCGIIKASGRFHSDWFLRFIGLEDFPEYRPGGRLQNYRGNPPLSDAAFVILQRLVYRAAQNLEQFDQVREQTSHDLAPEILITLASATLEQMASDDAMVILTQQLAFTRSRLLETQMKKDK